MAENDDQHEMAIKQKEARKNKRKTIAALDPAVLSDVNVQLTAILGQGTLTVRALLDLTDGSLIELGTPLDGSIEITLNDRLIAKGEIVAVGNQFGVRVTQVVAEPE